MQMIFKTFLNSFKFYTLLFACLSLYNLVILYNDLLDILLGKQ